MKRTHPILPALLLTGALAAQNMNLATHTVVGVFANDGNRDLQFVAQNTAINNPLSLTATVGATTATTIVAPTAPGIPFPGAFVSESGVAVISGTGSRPDAGTTAGTDPLNIVKGPHSLRLSYGGIVQGKIVVIFGGQATSGSSADAIVDLYDDGNIEFQQQADGQLHRQEFAINVVNGVLIKITTSGDATPGGGAPAGSYRSALSVYFEPSSTGEPPCQISPYGQGCGPRLFGNDSVNNGVHIFTLGVTNTFPTSPVAFVFGDRPVSVPIPGTNGCLFLTNPIVTVPTFSNVFGDATFFLRVPGPMGGVGFVQVLAVDLPRLRIESSNGLQVDCDV